MYEMLISDQESAWTSRSEIRERVAEPLVENGIRMDPAYRAPRAFVEDDDAAMDEAIREAKLNDPSNEAGANEMLRLVAGAARS